MSCMMGQSNCEWNAIKSLTINNSENKVLLIRPSRLSTMRNLDGHYPFLSKQTG